LPHHDHGHVEGVEAEAVQLPLPGEEDEIYKMEDDLHPRDLRRRPDRRQDDAGPPAGSGERRSGEDRRKEDLLGRSAADEDTKS